MSHLKTFTDSNFSQDVLAVSAHQPVLVDVWAPWCGPCRLVGPTIERVAETLAGEASVGKLSADEHPQVVQRYGITSIPTVLVFRDGEVVDSLVGVLEEADYRQAAQAAAARGVV